jgi:hypothetical protein
LRFRILSPDTFIHQYDLHLEHGQGVRLTGTNIEYREYIEDRQPGPKVKVRIPELGETSTAAIGDNGRAAIHFMVEGF